MNRHKDDLKTFSRTVGIVGLVAVVLLAVWSLNAVGDIRADQRAEQRQEKAERQEAVEYREKSQAALDEANGKIAALGDRLEDEGEDPGELGEPVTTSRASTTTRAELLNMLLVTCSTSDVCDGPPGPDGKDGDDGQPGVDGVAGADGAPGQDGRSITDIRCDGTTGVFTFDRGDPIRVDGMCPEDPEPPPDEEEPPGNGPDGRLVD